MKRSENGGALTFALIALAITAIIVAVAVYQYHENMLRYRLGPKSVPMVRFRRGHRGHFLARYRPLSGLRPKPVQPPVPSYNILGPLKDRKILERVLPTYPLWAEEQGVTGRVQLAFRVTSQGDVAPNVWVTQTIGYPDFDAVAVQALKQWKFVPLQYPDGGPEQEGIINFNFRLSNEPSPT